MSLKYVKMEKFSEQSGYTIKAIRRKMEEGVFIEGTHYRKAPDGRILINIVEYERWVESKAA